MIQIGDLIRYDNTLGVVYRGTESDKVFTVLMHHNDLYAAKLLRADEMELVAKGNQPIQEGDAVITYYGEGVVTDVEDIGKKMYFVRLNKNQERAEECVCWEGSIWKK